MKRIILGGMLMFAALSTVKAQNADNEWSIGLQMGSTHFRGDHVNEIINFDGIHGMLGIQVSKYINPFFDFQFGMKHGQVDGPGFYTNLFDFNALLKFKFSNGAIFKENSLIAPYVFAGFGDAVSESKNWSTGVLTTPYAYFNLPIGFGIDVNLSEKWKVSLETHYNYALTDVYDFKASNDRDDSFLFNSVGVAYNFSRKKDTDGDGVMDKDDACPEVAGLVALGGCPDSDNDGVADHKDACPNSAGTMKTNGCPDADGDGVEDSKDRCPDVAGKMELGGCLLSVEEVKVIQSAAEHILFATGSAEIKSESFEDLNKLAEILKSHQEVKASIEGHTDNTGNADLNLKLSKDRAASVKKYLISKGVKEDHLISEGYGQTRPMADNSTSDGRAKNRRVIIKATLFK